METLALLRRLYIRDIDTILTSIKRNEPRARNNHSKKWYPYTKDSRKYTSHVMWFHSEIFFVLAFFKNFIHMNIVALESIITNPSSKFLRDSSEEI